MRPSTGRYFDGLLSGDVEALVGSFAGGPELHHPTRGRVKGVAAFEHFVADQAAWLGARNAEIEPVDLIVTGPRTVEEVAVQLDGPAGRIDLPVAIATDRDPHDRLLELRVYFSTWPLTGTHAIRPPLLQPDPDARPPDVVGESQRALAAGDVEGAVAAFEPDGVVREPAGGQYVHCGSDEQRALYEVFFSNGGGIPLEHCSVTDDGRA